MNEVVHTEGDIIFVTGVPPAGTAYLKMIPGRTWNAALKRWELPLTAATLAHIARAFPTILIDDAVHQRIDAAQRRLAVAQQARETSWGGKGDMPVNGTPFAHQRAAYEVGLILLGVRDG